MIFVMSDVHGCHDKYLKMLEKIGFSDDDELYLLGDLVDRGPDSIGMLLDVMRRPNVHVLMGNHEDMAMVQFIYEVEPERIKNLQALQKVFSSWVLHNGGLTTYEAFTKRTPEEQREILAFVKKLPLWTKLTVNGQKYFLCHTVPGVEEMGSDPECLEHLDRNDYLWGEPDYDETYFDDTVIVTGHTPTEIINENHVDHIYRGHNHIAIDCAAVYGGQLACLCLDDGREWYVD